MLWFLIQNGSLHTSVTTMLGSIIFGNRAWVHQEDFVNACRAGRGEEALEFGSSKRVCSSLRLGIDIPNRGRNAYARLLWVCRYSICYAPYLFRNETTVEALGYWRWPVGVARRHPIPCKMGFCSTKAARTQCRHSALGLPVHEDVMLPVVVT